MSKLPLFPVTVVGSWARPPWLLDALRKRKAGQLSQQAFDDIADEAVLLAVKWQEDAGVDIVSDGEQRRDNYMSFVAEKLEGARLVSLAELMDMVEDKSGFEANLRQMDAPAFAIFNPTAVGKLERRGPIALDEYLFLREHTRKPIKVAMPGPYLMTRSMFVQGVTDKTYPNRDALAADVVRVLREEIRELIAAGCDFIQLDEPVFSEVLYKGDTKERTFMCGALSESSGDPDGEMRWAARLVNAVVTDLPKGPTIGLHVCRGNWSRQEEVLLRGAYDAMLPYLLIMQVDQYVLEFATPRAGELGVFSPYARARELGLGVLNPRSDMVETPGFIRDRVHEALEFFEPSQIYLNPDCGFGTFAERPLNPPKVAYAKLRAMAQAAETLRAEVGARARGTLVS